jgi:hypothetical protein
MNRWAIWVDIEGFSDLYNRDEVCALRSLGALMEALYNVASHAFRGDDERLFIHQFGDGFVVVSDFPESSPTRPIAISIAVMRHLLCKGIASKASISAGKFEDIRSCYPKVVMEASMDGRRVKIGGGVMTILPIMGSALINAYKLASQRPGSVLLVDFSVFAAIPDGLIFLACQPGMIDWIHSDLPMVKEICSIAGLEYIKPESSAHKLQEYIKKNRADLPEEWISSTLNSLGMTDDTP